MRKLTKPEAQQMAVARKVRRGGRPAPRMLCGWGCGYMMSARSIRHHFTDCPKRPKENA